MKDCSPRQTRSAKDGRGKYRRDTSGR